MGLPSCMCCCHFHIVRFLSNNNKNQRKGFFIWNLKHFPKSYETSSHHVRLHHLHRHVFELVYTLYYLLSLIQTCSQFTIIYSPSNKCQHLYNNKSNWRIRDKKYLTEKDFNTVQTQLLFYYNNPISLMKTGFQTGIR